jgi:major vault protein
MDGDSVIRIKPFHYIHVLDNNSNVTKVVVGPRTFTRADHEKVVGGPEAMIIIPPRHYCIIQNPVLRDKDGRQVTDSVGQVKIRHGDEEIRFEQEPFPLFPGETLFGKVSPLQVVAPNTALKLRAIRDFKDGKVARVAGDEWLFQGPGTYTPRVEVQVVEIVRAIVIKPNQALRLRSKKEFADPIAHVTRRAGDEYLVKTPGAFIPQVEEEVVETVSAYVLTDKKALHLQALRTFVDAFGATRKAGEEWLVTLAHTETHIPDVNEKLIGEVSITTLTNRQYCVVLDPVGQDGKPQMGKRILRKGPISFFLQPGERLEAGIQTIHVLDAEEALLLRAREAFKDLTEKEAVLRKPGDRWMIYGPCDYVPSVEVEVVEKRRSIPLDENEGIYVRDIKTGRVRMLTGRSYMLLPEEELWEKELTPVVEDLILRGASGVREGDKPSGPSGRDKTRVVSFRAPHNTAVQIYDYKLKQSRVVYGPELVMLGPDEHFTILSLSGDKPKRPHVIKSIALQLGPDFMTDFVIVETADHARLSLKLSYNWHFEVPNKSDQEEAVKLFQVPDFVGDACKAIASRVRGAVAQESFDNFHKNSAKIIRAAVFGTDDNGKIKNRFHFPANNLVIDNIDIQSVEPVDQRTRDALQISVQLAIEITTKSQEAAARHEAERREQEARGRLERQKITDEAEAEKARKDLLQLQAQSAAVESTGQATAEAKARAEAQQIEGEAAVLQARLHAEAVTIKSAADLEINTKEQEAEIEHQKSINELEIAKAKDLSTIESAKFKSLIGAIGKNTISAIARAGPEMQVKMLQSLGLQGYMITDGNSPINLFNTANGLLGGAGMGAPQH